MTKIIPSFSEYDNCDSNGDLFIQCTDSYDGNAYECLIKEVKHIAKQYAEHMVQEVMDEKERLEHDYACVLDHATGGRMSKTNYYLNDIYSEINKAQQENIQGLIRDDIYSIIEDTNNNKDTLDEIKKYLSNQDHE